MKINTSIDLKSEIKNIMTFLGTEIRGRFIEEEDLITIREEIKANYINGNLSDHFKKEKDDIRMKLFNLEHPILEKTINNVNIKICQGLLRGSEKTCLLFSANEIIGEFFSIEDIKFVVKKTEAKFNKICAGN